MTQKEVANEIVRKASAFFAKAKLYRPLKR